MDTIKHRPVAHTSSYLMGPSETYIEIKLLGNDITDLTRLVHNLGKSGAVASIPLMPSYCAQRYLSFYFYLAQLWIPFCLSLKSKFLHRPSRKRRAETVTKFYNNSIFGTSNIIICN